MTASYSDIFLASPPSFEELANSTDVILLEFGTDWCSHCLSAQALITGALEGIDIHHLKIMDGKGKRLGRRFRVKLWPTLILLKDGEEIARCIRPTQKSDISTLLQSISVTAKKIK